MTALIETVRVRDGRAPLWELHRRRLARSAAALGIEFPAGLEAPLGGADRVHRLEVGPGGAVRSERELPPAGAVDLVTVPTVHPGYPHKTTGREAFTLAEAEAAARGGTAGLLLTAEGYVAEGTIWCVYWWEGDRLAAPPLALGILEGVSRVRLGLVTRGLVERRVRPDDLRGRSILLSNAVRGVVEVRRWNGDPVPSHPGTGRLGGAFWP